MNANKKIINQIIRNVVQQNSVPDGTMPSSESSFALNKYLDDPHTVDLVYINLIERIRNEKSNYEQVLSRILKLIKNNIAIHPPSYQILLELDLFFISLSINSSLLIQKTVTYIRALIAHQVKQNPNYDVLKKQSNIIGGSGGIINNDSSGGSGHKRTNSSSIGFLRYRSHSASNSSVNTNKDDFSYQRSSLDLSNLLATSVSSTTSSNSSSSSSSPISLNESPLKNTLLNNNNSGNQNNQNSHLSPTLSSHNNNISASSSNNDPNLISSVTSSTSTNSNNINNVINSNNNNINSSSTGSNLSIGHGNNNNNNNNNILSNSSNQLGGSTNTLRESTSSMSSNGTPNFFLLDGFIRDLMSIKASTKSPAGKTQSLLTHSPFGGLNHQNGESNIKSINKDIFKCPDDSQNWSKINIVRESKKKAEKKDQTISLTFRRRKPALFQYKYYKDQESLKITEQEITQVVRVIINPATPQDRSIATKIFIKIILDIYCRDGLVVQSSEKLISNYFHQFISSTNRDTRAHTFNILFNLSVHINLYSELKLEDYQNGGNGGGLNYSGNSLSMIQDLHESIFRIVIEMVKHLVESREKDERTWSEALNCVLFFITEEGAVIKDKLFQLSAQMVASFLTNISSMTDSVKRVLVRMLSNFLYKDSISNVLQIASTNGNSGSTSGGNLLILNDDEFNSIGGIQFILQLYTTVRSSEAKNNLFVIIFDYVLQTALKTQTIVDAQIVNESPLLLELFRRSDASHYFTQIFKCIPEHGFISKFFLYTSEEAKNSNDSSFSYEDLIIKFTMKLEEFATRYQGVDASFERLIIDCQDVPEKLLQLTTDSLANEDDEVTLLNVENWLFLLLKRVLIDKDQANYPQFNFSIQVYSNLASSNTRLRRMYISLTERLLLLMKFRLSTNETKTNEIFEMFNERFTKLIGQGEKSESNLMYMVDVMFDMIYKRSGTGLLRSKESTPDTNYSLFLSNQFVVSISLLKLFNINVIQYLFNNIQNSNNTKEQRLFLLHILIQRCNDSEDLLKVGGIGFFKNLLSDLSTPIAYHSSYFLLAQLEAESPEQYRSILTRLLQKARDSNNENLLSNPFYQVQGIVEMSVLHRDNN